MPSLTIRSFAELLNLPAHVQARLLTEQKYPKQGPPAFKTPYYQKASLGIRAYYKAGNDLAQITIAKAGIEGLKQDAKRDNNLRVLGSFVASGLAKRALQVGKATHLSMQWQDVQLRFSPDLHGNENGAERLMLLNYRAQPLDPDLARTTLELAHWALEYAGSPKTFKQLEYVDLFTNQSFTISKRRTTTVSAAEQNLKIIQAIWPTL